MPSATAETPDGDVLTIVRTFAAPRELVFRLWTDPMHRAMWSGPEGHGTADIVVEPLVGGRWHETIVNPDGTTPAMFGVFTEVTPPSRLCFTYVFPEAGVDSLIEIDFVTVGEGTEMRFRQAPFVTARERDNHGWGWNSSLDVLVQYLQHMMISGDKAAWNRRLDGVAADVLAARERQEQARKERT